MAKKTPHPLAHILHAIADGKAVQWLFQGSGGSQWIDFDPTRRTIDVQSEWRIKPAAKYQVLFFSKTSQKYRLTDGHFESKDEFLATVFANVNSIEFIKLVEETKKEE